MAMIKALYTQYFPASPTLTEKDVGSQVGKVFIITGSNTGVGFDLVKMLYPSGATIYMAGRSEERMKNAIQTITSVSPAPATPATLKYLPYDLADLSSVKSAAEIFLSQETRLDILWHNAGIGGGLGLTTKQNIEGHIGINCVAPLLFTELLLPRLTAAAKTNASSRIIWTSSAITEVKAPAGGISLSLIEKLASTDPFADYAGSKVGNYWLAAECARRYAKDGIISVAQNPGNVKSEFYRHQPGLMMVFVNPILYEPKMGAYTGLFAGFSNDITTTKNNGAYIWPWGVIVGGHSRKDIQEGIVNGRAGEFWEWCREKYVAYL
ncbi:NAD(P)-binding Rossmann-fold containing protein [Glarea lozoyensis ATCC 20868]|uniref:NAD(P)-binding Rossmann-fold containing protein n=1 Tax=Glarea lozoyensis (strain ATCC 20868 / MF5171) TaxID=1116229 RepID=S3CYA5_GLAL2|nr:NAD(P)-binding Rossmann-fold containing protein [Glarea lozoyensis ATCC 20868]EPE30595.1 NAD(P)-binding Rossmann-fold containing protein [Glarea lozoyensis ATCC 20868]